MAVVGNISNQVADETGQIINPGTEETLDAILNKINIDFLIKVKMELIPGYRLIHKFGRNQAVGTSFVPVSINGVYRTPAANQTDLEIVSSDADDDIAGAGAQKVIIEGAKFSNNKIIYESEEISLDGLTPIALVKDYARIFRAWISQSGSYATTGIASAQGIITISENISSDEWLVIDQFAANNSAGQSQTTLYTSATDTISLLLGLHWTIEGNKTVGLIFFRRPDVDDVVSPYSGARRIVQQYDDAINATPPPFGLPIAFFKGSCDMGFMAINSVGTAKVSADFWLLEIDINYL